MQVWLMSTTVHDVCHVCVNSNPAAAMCSLNEEVLWSVFSLWPFFSHLLGNARRSNSNVVAIGVNHGGPPRFHARSARMNMFWESHALPLDARWYLIAMHFLMLPYKYFIRTITCAEWWRNLQLLLQRRSICLGSGTPRPHVQNYLPPDACQLRRAS